MALSLKATATVYEKKYVSIYKRMLTWEGVLNYDAMHALAWATVSAGTAEDVLN